MFAFDLVEELVALHFSPNLFDGFVFDVSDSVGVVVAAGDGVTVFCDAHEFAEEASAQKEVVVPIVKVWHAALFGN